MNLLIADDEPLVLAGIKSMIDWEKHNIHIVGTAANGAIAYDMIREYSPEIVITDIKMPVMSGLELAQKCKEEHRILPVFIILTSYEEFEFAKQALAYQVIDYLVKIELTQESLENTIGRAVAKVLELQSSAQLSQNSIDSICLLREQFFTRLLLNLFESERQFLTQAENLHIAFPYEAYTAAYVEINDLCCLSLISADNPVSQAKSDANRRQLNSLASIKSSGKQLHLYTGSLQIASELIPKYTACHVLSLDIRHFAIIFFLEQAQSAIYKETIKNALRQIASMLFSYYNVTLRASVGSIVNAPLKIASSFQDAKQFFPLASEDNPILFAEDMSSEDLYESFAAHNKDYKTHIVANVKKYINEHIDEKLTLNKVAEVFNISSNYLSILFSKCNDVGFIDYVNQSKVAAAKEMMQTGNLKIYEISDVLGFESAFYFSRVFKKVTGMSPRDYINLMHAPAQ